MTTAFWKGNASSAPWAPPAYFSIGFPTAGDLVTGTPPTYVGATWFQGMAEEIRNVIEAAGLSFDPTDTTQFYQAIVILLGATFRPAVLTETGIQLLTEAGLRITV